MIAKMEKLTLLVYHKEHESFLKVLRDLGVVHIAEKQQGVAENVELQDNLRLSTRLTTLLKQFQALNEKSKQTISAEKSAERGCQILDEVEVIQTERNRLNTLLQSYDKDEKLLEPWGNFSLGRIRDLREAGFNISFYSCPERSYNAEWEETYHAVTINKVASKIYFVTVTKIGEEMDIDAEPVRLPKLSLSEIKEEIRKSREGVVVSDQKLSELAAKEVESLKAAIDELHRNIEFSKVLLNSEKTAGDKLMLLQGWVPAQQTDEVEQYLDKCHVYYELVRPTPEDDVPVLLRNKGLFAWFEPICKLYMLPKYGELDLTPFFAPFFMIFFGLCLGDSGYGLFLFLGVTVYRAVAKNVGSTMKAILSLVQVLAISTFFAGMLTGTFFGFDIYDLNWPIVIWMKEHIYLDNNEMFKLSLVFGVIQIMFGMILKVANQIIQFGFKYAVATLGWVIFFLSIIFAILFPSVLPLFKTTHLVITGIAAAMIFLCNSPGKNLFLNIGLGFWDSYNMATGLLGDILSYVRLFALGLSGGILASVFNSLAVGMSPDNVIAKPIVMILIFLIGHAINMFMNVLGALVHPMRLTFVEFFKNAGYEGGGKEYKPFKN